MTRSTRPPSFSIGLKSQCQAGEFMKPPVGRLRRCQRVEEVKELNQDLQKIT
jgi:hypothetical protein